MSIKTHLLKRHSHALFGIALAFALLMTLGRPVAAANFKWATPTSGSFATPGNWSPVGVPGSFDTATFNLQSSGYTVLLPSGSSSTPIEAITVGSDNVTLDGNQRTLAAAGQVTIGDAAISGSHFTLIDGNVSGATSIGATALTSGTLTVDGTQGANWDGGNLSLGDFGTGTLQLINGGTMTDQVISIGTNASSSGEIDIDGKGSQLNFASFFTLGDFGNAALHVSNGGQFIPTGAPVDIRMADKTGSQSIITAADPGTLLNFSPSTGMGTSTIQISNGAAVQSDLQVSLGAFKGGTVNAAISGTGSTWNASGDFYVGLDGAATMKAQTGSSVSITGETSIAGNAGSSSTLTISDSGTSWSTNSFGIGTDGNGTTTVSRGASVAVTGQSFVGGNDTSTSTLTIQDPGTKWSSASMSIAISGTGTATVQNGAAVSIAGLTTVGSNILSHGKLTIDGSQFNSGSFLIGNAGTGTVTVQNGSVVSVDGSTSIANDHGGRGTLTVTGAGSQWNTGSVMLNDPGAVGTITVRNGGVVSVATRLANNQGKIDVSGGGSLTIGTIAANLAQNASPASNPFVANTVQIGTGGTLSGVGQIIGSVINSAGVTSITTSVPATTLTINGDYTQLSGGTLRILALNQPGGSTVSPLIVNGNVSLGGTLDFSFFGLSPGPGLLGKTFDLVSASGNFSLNTLTTIPLGVPAGFKYTTHLDRGVYSITITSVPEPSSLILASLCGLAFLIYKGPRLQKSPHRV